MRSLWTGASAMSAQQLNIDTISNNLSNVSTFGFKKERLEFQSLLYDTMTRASLDPANDSTTPVNMQVGHGVRPIATSRITTTGSFQQTGITTDIAINGSGYLLIDRGDGNISYSKDGALKTSLTGNGLMLSTAQGYPVLDSDEQPIYFPEDMQLTSLVINQDGQISYLDAEGTTQDLGVTIGLVQFQNQQGLEAIGSNLYIETVSSGEPMFEADGNLPNRSTLVQGYLEMSNVQVADEMVNLIVAQRAYELASKAITTSDEMLQTANGLKR